MVYFKSPFCCFCCLVRFLSSSLHRSSWVVLIGLVAFPSTVKPGSARTSRHTHLGAGSGFYCNHCGFLAVLDCLVSPPVKVQVEMVR